MQKILNNEFEVLGIENVLLPLFIKTSEFVKEQKHIEGFAPEAYIVTKVGQEVLEDPLIVRPTSEVLFSQLFSQTANTYKQLPLKYNQ
jgi:prolyl-tRNA synthetase